MNLTESIAPKSDQLNADDLMFNAVTVTIRDFTTGTSEQFWNYHLVEFPTRAYRPSKTMVRLMRRVWGEETDGHLGRRLTLFRNPEIMFGREKVGGIEISHMSHIDKPQTHRLTVARGKTRTFTVTPLADATPTPQDTSGRDWLAELTLAGADLAAVGALGNAALAAHADTVTLAAIRELHTMLKAAQ